MHTDITGVILAGGRSKRMGTNKALLKINEISIIESIRNMLQSIFEKVILITNTPEDYSFLSIEIFEDIYKWKGPLAGIHSALMHSKTEEIFVISCDIPLMTNEMIEYLVNFKTDKPITIAKADGFTQQLCGIYKKDVLAHSEKLLMEEQNSENPITKKCGCKVLQLVKDCNAEIIDAELLPFYIKNTYLNMNKVDDYEMLKSILLNNKNF